MGTTQCGTLVFMEGTQSSWDITGLDGMSRGMGILDRILRTICRVDGEDGILDEGQKFVCEFPQLCDCEIFLGSQDW